MTEETLQSKCFQWFWNDPRLIDHRQMLFHVQQKAKNAIEGARFKAIGVVKGISDLVLILSGGRVVWIELKLPEGQQSKEQIDFQRKVEKRGHKYVIVRTLKEFQDLILYEIDI